jgi:hypothetical protein
MKRAASVDAAYVVPTHQIESGKVSTASWRDPEDNSPLRRVARQVSGYRSSDSIQALFDKGAISRGQSKAAMRLRRSDESGVIGMRGGPQWGSAPTSFGPGPGPSEIQLQNLERYDQAMAALGRLGDIVLHDQSLC